MLQSGGGSVDDSLRGRCERVKANTGEGSVFIFTSHKLAGFPRVTKRPSPILYWDSGKSETTVY